MEGAIYSDGEQKRLMNKAYVFENCKYLDFNFKFAKFKSLK